MIVDGYTQCGGQHPHTAALENLLFTTHGLDSLAEMQAISDRLHGLESEYNGAFPMSDAETQDLFADMQTRLGSICEAKVEALNALQRAI
jgi:hypothetical protein